MLVKVLLQPFDFSILLNHYKFLFMKKYIFFGILLFSYNITSFASSLTSDFKKNSFDTIGPFTLVLPPNSIRTDIYPGVVSDFTNNVSGSAEYNAIPNLIDIDGDGDFDLVAGTQFKEEIYLFENIGTPENPKFKRAVTNPFEGLCLTNLDGCTDNTFVDFDLDGDLDMIGPKFNFISFPNYWTLAYFENIGNATQPKFQYKFNDDDPFKDLKLSFLIRPTFEDIDDDGDWDLIAGTSSSTREIGVWLNTGSNSSPNFEARIGSSNPFDNFTEDGTKPILVDIDNDLDLDLMVGVPVHNDEYNGNFSIMENIGDRKNPEYEFLDRNDPRVLLLQEHIPAFSAVDLDNDEDIDLIVGSNDGQFHYYRNEGDKNTINFVQRINQDNPFHGGVSSPNNSTPILKDFDKDGDFDLVLGVEHGGDPHVFKYYQNTGSQEEPNFSLIYGSNNPFRNITDVLLDVDEITAGDIDGDGDYDILASNRIVRNIGSATEPIFEYDKEEIEVSSNSFVNYNYPELGDIDADGDLDLLLNPNAEFRVALNEGSSTNPNWVMLEGADSPLDGIIVNNGDEAFTKSDLIDVDNDGDLDILVGGIGAHGGLGGFIDDSFYFIENVGDSVNAIFELREEGDNPLAGLTLPISDRFPEFADLDNDGDVDLLSGTGDGSLLFYRNEAISIPLDEDGDGFFSDTDCNDMDPNINPNQTEVPYNGLDDDCDTATLDDDLDQDGFLLADDCDDNNPDINPDQTEDPYNGLDDDCDNTTLDDDLDQDGFLLADDCDDNNPDINPDQIEEPYNGIDDDCDTATLDDDLDQDGFLLADDCDDNNPDINPDQTEEPYNGLDDDCDTATLDDDLDQDGFLLAVDCDDNNPDINPDQTEEPYNGLDDDCDTATLDDDLDQDGFLLAVDCDDNNPDINPDQTEEPYNGLDDDCDTTTLDDDLDQDGFLLADDCDDENANINPDAEDIPNNGIDEDCDGQDLVTSIREIANTKINIFPNPVYDEINIEILGEMSFKSKLYDMEGKLFLSSINVTQINVTTIPSGIYLLEIIDLKTNQKIIEKIVLK